MTRRFLALLLTFCIALQSLIPAVAGAQTIDVSAAAHCGESAQAMDHGSDIEKGTPACPHCDHASATHAGCASHCMAAVVLPSPLTIALRTSTMRFDAIAPAVLTRFDIPPTPPPIA